MSIYKSWLQAVWHFIAKLFPWLDYVWNIVWVDDKATKEPVNTWGENLKEIDNLRLKKRLKKIDNLRPKKLLRNKGLEFQFRSNSVLETDQRQLWVNFPNEKAKEP